MIKTEEYTNHGLTRMDTDKKKLPEGWDCKKLGEVCEIVNGGTPKSSIKEYWNGYINWVTPKDIGKLKNRYIRETPRKITEYGLQKSSAKLFPPRSLILSTRAPIGHLAINLEEMSTNQGCRGIVPGANVFTEFLYYYLSNSVDLLNNLGNGTTFKELSSTPLKNFKIPLPPLLEQKRIVSILDEAFAAIDQAKTNAEKNLANANNLFESYLNGVFANPGEDWENKKLGDICSIKHGFAFEGKFFSNEGDYVLLTPGNFYEKGGYRYRGEKQKYYTGEIPQDFILDKGDLLIAMTEQAHGLLGSSMIVPEHNKFLHNQRLGLVEPAEGVVWNTEFFAHLFNTVDIRNQIESSASGVKVRHTSPKKISDINVNIPVSLSTQKEIVHNINLLEKETKQLESIYQQKIAALDELKKSVLKKAFEGEL